MTNVEKAVESIPEIKEDLGAVRNKLENGGNKLLLELLRMLGYLVTMIIVSGFALSRPEVVKAVISAEKAVPR